jgi:FSR family fosmidomycin resistance protein-like MFS transporter
MKQQTSTGIAWGGVLLVAIGHAAVDFYMGILPPLMPIIVKQLGLSLTLAASIMAIASTLSSFSQPVFGYLIDRGGKNWLLVVAVLWTGLFCSAIGFAKSYWAVVALALLGSIGSAFYHPVGSTNATGLAGQGNRGLALSIYSTTGSLGYALAPIALTPLLAASGTARLPWLFLIAVLCALAMVAARIHAVPSPSTRRNGAAGSFTKELSAAWRPLLLLLVVVSLRAWAQSAVTFLVPFAFAGKGANLLLSLFLLAGTLGSLLGGFVSDRLGRKRVLIGSSLFAVPLFALAGVAHGAAAWWLLIIGGTILNAAFPATIVFAQELVPGNAGFASGVTMGMAWGLGALGLTVTGAIADSFGPGAGFMLNGALLLAAVACTLPLRMRAPGAAVSAAD